MCTIQQDATNTLKLIMAPLLLPLAYIAFLTVRTPSSRNMHRLASTSHNAIASLPSLNSSDGTALTLDAIADRLSKKHVALYFSAGWCPMCTSFEPSLLRFRASAASSGKDIEIIYVPSDRTEVDVVQRTQSLGMMSVPIQGADEIKKRWKIWAGVESVKLGTGRRSGIPALVVLDSKSGAELAFLPTESQGSQALNAWPLDNSDGVW